jgi:hypothetical protein
MGPSEPMTVPGQRHRFERRPIASGLPPTPDIFSVDRHLSLAVTPVRATTNDQRAMNILHEQCD